MSVTFVYDGTDATRFWFNELRRQLQLVQPKIQLALESCEDLEDESLDKTHPFLLVMSKKTSRLHKRYVISLINKTGSGGNIFLVIETEGNINENFDNLPGKSNTAYVDDLLHSFKWLPKVCVFLFKMQKSMSSQENQCIVPRINNDPVSLALREDLLSSILELGIKVSENTDDWSIDNMCVILRSDNKEPLETSISDKRGQNGMICLEYILHFEDKTLITFSKNSQLLFLLHLLHQSGLVRIKTINNKTMDNRRLLQVNTNIDMPKIVRFDCFRCPCKKPSCSCELTCTDCTEDCKRRLNTIDTLMEPGSAAKGPFVAVKFANIQQDSEPYPWIGEVESASSKKVRIQWWTGSYSSIWLMNEEFKDCKPDPVDQNLVLAVFKWDTIKPMPAGLVTKTEEFFDEEEDL